MICGRDPKVERSLAKVMKFPMPVVTLFSGRTSRYSDHSSDQR